MFTAWLCPVGGPDGPFPAKHLFSFLEEVVGPPPCLEAASPFRASGVSIEVCLGSLTAHLNETGGSAGPVTACVSLACLRCSRGHCHG